MGRELENIVVEKPAFDAVKYMWSQIKIIQRFLPEKRKVRKQPEPCQVKLRNSSFSEKIHDTIHAKPASKR